MVCSPHRNLPPALTDRRFLGTLTAVDAGNLVSEPYPTVQGETYKEFYTQLVKAIDGGAEVPVKPEEAASVIRLVELAKQSSEEGRTLDV